VGEGWVRALLRGSDGFMIGLTQHDGTPRDEAFDHQRIGLDHISINCSDRLALESWRDHLDGVGVEHGPIVDAPAGSLLVCRDPDGIPVEFFASP
jgi:glyoxylase I family protein